MPLYKRKIASQKPTKDKVSDEILKRNAFKTPLIINDIKLNRNNAENPIIKENQKDTQLSRQFNKSPLAEYNLNFNGFKEYGVEKNELCELNKNSSKDQDKNSKAGAKESRIKYKTNKKKNEQKHGKNYKESKFNIFKEAKKEIMPELNDSKLSQVKKLNLEIDCNNNIRKDKTAKKKETVIVEKISAKRKRDSNDHDTSSSNLEEMVMSLWSQEKVPSKEPPENISHYERLVWLQQQRNVGLYVNCDKCNKYRYLKDTVDPLELPDKWYCYMNPDKKHNRCSDPETEIKSWEEADLIYNTYHAGSIVWAKLDGYPWWPAMIDDDPDTEMYYWLDEYSCIPTYYNVVFFDSKTVSRSWLKPDALRKFKGNDENELYQTGKRNMFRSRLNVAKTQAKDALKLTVANRLKEYSFLARWPDTINTPADGDYTNKSKKRYKKGTTQRKWNRSKISKSNTIKSPSLKKANNEEKVKNSYFDDESPDLFDEREKIFDDLLSLEDAITNNFVDI